ncbi:MAG: isocitrate lyase/PEP mutase family protein [Terriglobales bacterium]
MTQAEKARQFRQLHHGPAAFLIPNPWDAGSARLLAHAGFAALATTSMGSAFSQGRDDGALGRERTLAYAAAIVAATELPVSADLENGFGDAPEAAAETIRRAAAVGLVGGSIEDATGNPADPIYPLPQASERVRAAVEAAHRVPGGFVLTARAENYLHGRADLGDTIRRLQAYQEAGADVLYAPGLKTKEDIQTVVRAVDRPVNVLVGLAGLNLSRADLSALGVKRLSLGSSLYRVATGAFLRAIREMTDDGTFNFAAAAANSRDLAAIFRDAEAGRA